jgi:hypothetical protein
MSECNDTIITEVDNIEVIESVEQGPPGPVRGDLDGGKANSVYLIIQHFNGGHADG